MKRWMIAVAVIFVSAAVVGSSTYACERTKNQKNKSTMPANGGKGFKRSCDQGEGGEGQQRGGGKHRGGKGGGENKGNHYGQHKKDQSGESTGNGDNTNQAAGDPTDAEKYPDSASLVTEAWNSYNKKDYATAEAFADETINRYSAQAKEQQASLSDFAPEGKEADYWALNDVATAHFIKGSAYQAQGENDLARAEFETIINDYGYAQCYDPEQDLYWKVAEGAQKALDSLPAGSSKQSQNKSNGQQSSGESGEQPGGSGDSGEQPGGSEGSAGESPKETPQETPTQTPNNQDIDFTQYTDSQSLVTKAWESFNNEDWETTKAFAQETITRYQAQAEEQQASLSDFAPAGQESQYWALNDVATSYFLLAKAYLESGDLAKAQELFQLIIDKFGFAQCFDPEQNIYWKVAEAAQKELDGM